jgi:ElaB/YqjD/DUF883 family membrane-anchored ribosome-binding protein
MAKPHSNGSHASSLSEAIDQLESASQSKSKDFKDILEKDYEELKNAINDLKPHLEELRDKVESQVKTQYQDKKNQVEEKVKENPWLALGIINLIAFVVGWILGQGRKD